MKSTQAAIVLVFFLTLSVAAQTTTPAPLVAPQASQASASDLETIFAEIQRITIVTDRDLATLRIDRWKTDSSQKQQMQRAVESLQRNLATIMPGPVNELRIAPASVSRSFKLYNNLNLVYEFLNSLTDAAGSLGKAEEYEPLANDLNALDKVRHSLSRYTEQTASNLETDLQAAKAQQALLEARAEAASQAAALRKVVMADTPPAKKPRKVTRKAAITPAPPQ